MNTSAIVQTLNSVGIAAHVMYSFKTVDAILLPKNALLKIHHNEFNHPISYITNWSKLDDSKVDVRFSNITELLEFMMEYV